MTTSSHTRYWISKILMLCLSILVDGVHGVRPACDIPPTDLNQLATITCYLPEKVLQDKQSFRVTHLTRNNTVVNAEWEDGQYMFSPEDDISMDGQKQNDRFTFKMYPVTRNRTGIYACIPEGYEQEDVGTCTLSLKSEKSKSTNMPSVGRVNENENEYTNQPEYIVLVAACCVLTVIIVSGLIGFLIYRKQKNVKHKLSCRKNQDQRKKDLETKESESCLISHKKDSCEVEPIQQNGNVIKCETNHKACNGQVFETNNGKISLCP